MSRLDDAIETLRKAAGDRRWCLVVDRRSAQSSGSSVDVVTTPNFPTYAAKGLLRDGIAIIDAKYPIIIGDAADDEDP